MSQFDSMMAQAVPAAIEAAGTQGVIGITLADGSATTIYDAIFGRVRQTVEIDSQTGDAIRRERTTVHIPTAVLMEAGFTSPQRGAVVNVLKGTRAGQEWAIDADSTVWGETMVELGLMRSPLVAKGDLRRGPVQ